MAFPDNSSNKWHGPALPPTSLLKQLVTKTEALASGGGLGGSFFGGTVNLVDGQQQYSIVFSSGGASFALAPTKLPAPTVAMPDSNGEILTFHYDLSTLTASGVTGYLSAPPTSASNGGKIYWTAAQ